MSEAETSQSGDDRFTTLVAIMIALVALIGAVVAWRASVAED